MPMETDTTFLALAELLYEAALQGGGWEQVLKSIAQAYGASGAAMLGIDTYAGRVGFRFTYRLDAEEMATRGLCLAGGDARAFSDVLFVHDALRLENEALAPIEIARWLKERRGETCYVGARMLVAPGELALAILDSGAGMTIHGVVQFRKLAPHAERALQISRRLAELDLHSSAVGDTLEMLPFGVFLIDAEQKVRFANRSARDVIADRDGLELREAQLHATEAGWDERLDRLLRVACAADVYLNKPPGGGLLLERPSGQRPYSILVMPLGREEEQLVFATESPAAAVFVTDPARRERLPQELLQSVYALTQAEARLACLIAAGLTLDEAAEELGTARGTVRVHLERIFRKTGTHRQPDLVRLLLTSPALVKGPPER